MIQRGIQSGDARTAAALQQQQAAAYNTVLPFEPAYSTGQRDAEMDRIVNLPIAQPLPPDFRRQLNDDWLTEQAKRNGFALWDEQVDAIYTYWNLGGAFCPIGCGFGKTLISFKDADVAYQYRGLAKGLLMVPPKLARKTNKDLTEARHRIKINVPFVNLAGETKKRRGQLAKSGRRACYVFPYSYLQTTDAADLLDWIDPDYLIMDEAHTVKNVDAPMVGKLLSYLARRENEGRPVEMVAMSGTMTSKRLMDYHHTLCFSLRHGAPVPLQPSRVQAWDDVLDVNAYHQGSVGALAELVRWAQHYFPDELIENNRSGFRKAYGLRLNSTPGVVSTGDREVSASLTVQPLKIEVPEPGAEPDFDTLTDLIKVVKEAWITPNGDEIAHAFHLFKWECELSCGFYNRLRWPTPEETMRKFNVDHGEAERRIYWAQLHLLEQNKWHRAVRDYYQTTLNPRLATPRDIANYIYTHGSVPNDDFGVTHYYEKMKELEFEGMPERISEPIRVSDFKVRQIVEWAKRLKKDEGCIVWCTNNAFREWLVEAMNEAGIERVIDGRSGDPKVEELILNPQRATGKRMILMMKGYLQGHNMQFLPRMLFGQMERQALVAEQGIARIHREGFPGDNVLCEVACGLPNDRDLFQACCNDALYIHESLRQKQRLIIADYPEDFGFVPVDVLRARVPDLEALTPAMRERWRELFETN